MESAEKHYRDSLEMDARSRDGVINCADVAITLTKLAPAYFDSNEQVASKRLFWEAMDMVKQIPEPRKCSNSLHLLDTITSNLGSMVSTGVTETGGDGFWYRECVYLHQELGLIDMDHFGFARILHDLGRKFVNFGRYSTPYATR